MESRSYNFSTARKRSTLLESKGIEYMLYLWRFPKDDINAPRMRIVKKECPPEFEAFIDCLSKNSAKPELCVPIKEKLFECGRPGFKKANTDPDYEYWLQMIMYETYQFCKAIKFIKKSTKIQKSKVESVILIWLVHLSGLWNIGITVKGFLWVVNISVFSWDILGLQDFLRVPSSTIPIGSICWKSAT
jgi:hypothetical protein